MTLPNPFPAFTVMLLVSCVRAPIPDPDFSRPQPRSDAEIAFVKHLFNRIQPRSIAENREYCGYLGLNEAGEYIISGPRRGGEAGCDLWNPPADMRVLASYHTHGAYDLAYDTEVPSAGDLREDIIDGIDGYIATPGGRIWYDSAQTGQALLLCGLNCVMQDPGFSSDTDHLVRHSFSLADLQERQR